MKPFWSPRVIKRVCALKPLQWFPVCHRTLKLSSICLNIAQIMSNLCGAIANLRDSPAGLQKKKPGFDEKPGF
jgi:hypothetical protein